LNLFFFAFIENVFPPSPSDVVVVVGASLIATSSVKFIPVLAITSIGSALGFILMYYVGILVSKKVLRVGKIRFISEENLNKADIWFNRWGYWLILVNRFLPGTRSVISFFSGVHKLKVIKTFFFALISATLWNIFMVYLGMELGENAEAVDRFLHNYSNIVVALTALIALLILIKHLGGKRRRKS
jgi:membrane protein DedA with SNARE-associated domain